MNKISFSTAQLNRLFPFYLTVDMELTVTSAGDAVDRIFGGVRGYKLNEIFKLDELHVLSASFLKEVIGENIELYHANNLSLYLKAEVDYIEDTNEFFIIGNPQLIKIDKEISQPPVGVNKDLHIGEKSQKYYQTYSGDITENAKEILNCILITDKEGKIEWVNRAFERTTGYNIEHAIGKRARQILYGPRSIYVTPNYVDDSVVKERPFSFQNIGYMSQNQAFWFEALVYPIFDKEHSISGRISIFQDITKIKEKEQLTEGSLQLWHFAMEKSGHGVFEFEIADRIIEVTEQFKKLLGYEKDTVVNWELLKRAISSSDLRDLTVNLLRNLNKNQPDFSRDWLVSCKDGVKKYLLVKISVVRWSENGVPLSLVGTISDIDELKQKDVELQNSAERLSALIDNLSAGVLLENENRTILQVNEEFCCLFSMSVAPELLIGADGSGAAEQSKELFADSDEFVSRIEELLRTKKKVVGDVLKMKNGKVLERDYIPIYINNNYKGHLWKYKDITELVESSDTLQKQKNYYNNILNEIPADIVVFTMEHRYEFINKNAIKSADIRAWIIGKDDYEYCAYRNLDIRLADGRRAAFNEVLNTRKPKTIVDEHINAAGVTEYVMRIMYPHLSAEGRVDFVIGFGIDISEQVRARQHSEVQEKRIENLLQIIKDGVFRCNADGTVNLRNHSFDEIMSLKAIDATCNFYDLLPQQEVKKIKNAVELLKTNTDRVKGVFHLPASNGENKHIEYKITPVFREEDGTFVGRISDITDSVNKEQHLKNIIEEEKELSSSKSRFIHITSHELRTPLAIIQANAEIIEMMLEQDPETNATVSYKKMLNRIVKEVVLMAEILNQLMTISKIEAGTVDYVLEDVNINQFLLDLRADLYEPFSDGRKLLFNEHDTIQFIQCDKKLLRHAIVNIINNAFKYSANKPAPILRLKQTDDAIIFEVQDFGIGIPEADKTKIFNSFYRASNVGVIQGTGLGLMVIDYAVKKHCGTIYFESVQNQGSIFSISLPKNINNDKGQDPDRRG